MKIKFLILAAMMLSLTCARAAGTNDAEVELKNLVDAVKIKLQSGQQTEVALAPELKQFDALLAEHKGEKTDAVASILLMKAALYSEVFQDKAKADALVQQLKTDFQGTKLVASLEEQEKRQQEAQRIQSALVTGAAFPDFNEKDVGGKPLAIANYKGKVVLVDFWATWCVPCRMEMPNVIAAYQKFHGQGFEVIGVSLDVDQQDMLAYAKEQGMDWPQYFDGKRWENILAVKYGIESIPASFLIDGDGKIIAKNLRGDQLDAAIAAALAKNKTP